MNIVQFFTNKKKCKHSKVSPQEDIAYCPDCGELVENRWYIARCSCCGIKLKAVIKNGEVTPVEHFCHNCGGNEFEAELVPKINCIDINYAVLVKMVIQPLVNTWTQSWASGQTPLKPKLLTQT